MAFARIARRAVALVVTAAVVATLVPGAAADERAEPVIVLLREGPDTDVLAVTGALRRSDGVRPTHSFRHAVQGFAADLTPSQVRRLEADPRVEAVVPDSVVELAAQTIPAGVRRVGAVAAPATRIDGVDGAGERVDVDVAIVDTGIQANHPDLNVVDGVDCVPDGITNWADQQGHGTHVAGTVGALDNGVGVVGVAPGARLWSVRVFDANAFSRISWIVCGIDWITAQRDANDPDGARIDVVNMSLRDPGRDDGNCGYSNADPEHRAICASVAAGTTYVVAAGNDRTWASKWRPASYNEVITVSAIADFDGKAGGLASAPCTSFGTRDVDDTFADFSNYGADVDITAPGVCVRSTVRGSSYGNSSGTSMAAPHVAGAAAVYKALHPRATPADVRAALRAAGSNAWAEGTDPDGVPEPLLDLSSFGSTPGISLRPIATSGSVWAGYGAVRASLWVVRGNGYRGNVTFEAEGFPAGVTATFTPATLTGWSNGPVQLVLQAASSVPEGSWNGRIVARGVDAETARPFALTVKVDASKPVATAPRLSLVTTAPRTMSPSSVPLRLSWTGTDAGSGIARYEQQESRDGAEFTAVPLAPPAATSRTLTAPVGTRISEQVRAVDNVGNASNWAAAREMLLVGLGERSSLVTYSGTWASASATSAWGGTTRHASAAGASATLRFNGRSVGWVATMGPTRGSARVYVDGVLVRTVSLYASTTRYRQIVFSRDLPDGAHTLRIVVVGTSGRPRVDIDGFLTVRPT